MVIFIVRKILLELGIAKQLPKVGLVKKMLNYKLCELGLTRFFKNLRIFEGAGRACRSFLSTLQLLV